MRLSTRTDDLVVILALAASFGGCLAQPDWECERSTDCADDEFCRAGTCTSAVGWRDVGGGAEVGVGSTDVGHPGEERCDAGRPPEGGDLIINEALVNVPKGEKGDANDDGIRDAFDDEFVEVVNRAEETLDLTGVQLANGTNVKFQFDALCLEPHEPAVVYGGGRPPDSDEAMVYVADSRFAFANNGGTVALFDEDEEVLSTLTYEQSPSEALTLDPQLDGEEFVPHSELSEERPHSPGRCADGALFVDGCSPHDEEE